MFPANKWFQKFIANLLGSGAFPVFQDHTHVPLLSFALLDRDLVGHCFTAQCTLVSLGRKHRQMHQQSAASIGQAPKVNALETGPGACRVALDTGSRS